MSLTRREEFAKAAMTGIEMAVANPDYAQSIKDVAQKSGMTIPQVIAKMARQRADALAEELDRTAVRPVTDPLKEA